MKKLLFAVAFSLVGFAAQAQCSKSCHASSPDCKTSCTVSKKGEASIKGEKSVATASKKRRAKKVKTM